MNTLSGTLMGTLRRLKSLGSIERKLNRAARRNRKELPMKKVLARKMGISVTELNERFFKKDDERRKEEC